MRNCNCFAACPVLAMLVLLGGCAGKDSVFFTRAEQPASVRASAPQTLQEKEKGLRPRLEAAEELWRDMNRELHENIMQLQQRLDALEQANEALTKELAEIHRNRKHVSSVSGKKAVSKAKPVQKHAPKPDASRELDRQKDLYTQSYLALKKGKYHDAAKGFAKYLIEFPHGKYANLTHFWLGEAYYALGDMNEAANEFSRVENATASRDKHARALWRRVQIAQQQGSQEEVLRNAQLLISTHPDSPEAAKVRRLLRRDGN